MIIRSVLLDTFGAKSGEKLEFTPGLNVVLGPNEAGKSTLVNALFAALFLKTGLNRRSAEWNTLLKKYLPYPHGDNMAVTVSFLCGGGGEHTLKRSWGAGREAVLTLPDGSRLRDEETLQQKVEEILGLGRGTFEGVLFARQDEMLRTVELLKSNREAVTTLAEVLRAAAFAAGGVSLDDLKAAIEEEKKNLLGNWDLERDGPKGNRGLDQPWVRGVGEILAAFYQVEKVNKNVRLAEAAERAVAELRTKLRDVRLELGEMRPRLQAMEKNEGDIRRRQELEPRLALLLEKEKNLKKLNEEWPRAQERSALMAGSRREEQERLAALENEHREAVAVVMARELRALLQAVKPLQAALQAAEIKLARLPVVTAEDVKALEKLRTQTDRQKAVLEAMKLKARLTAAGPLEVTVSSGLAGPEKVQVDGEATFSAEGRLVVETAEWKLEVQSGERDVAAIIADIGAAEEALQARLADLGVDSTEAVRKLWEERSLLEREIREQRIKTESLLKGKTFAQLEEEAAALPPDKAVKEPAAIMEEINNLRIAARVNAEKAAELQKQLDRWAEEHGSPEQVLDQLVTLRTEGTVIAREQETLSALPAGYGTPGEFLAALAALRQKARETAEYEARLRFDLAREEGSLPEYAADELRETLVAGENRLRQLKKRAGDLLVVEEEFARLTATLDRHTFGPLVQAFTRYLAPFTGNRYDGVQLEGSLPVSVVSGGRELPLELLSTGTSRGVALALRLAVAEHLLGERPGFMVMDDPLVDLDPDRKQSAAATIREYARSRQLIITTCDPATAALLGGRVVSIVV